MQRNKYASWIDDLLEEGVTLSEFKRVVKEQFPGVSLSLASHVRYRRSQGWKIVEERREDGDVFYKLIEKPEKKRRKGKGSSDSGGGGVVVKEVESVSESSGSESSVSEGVEQGVSAVVDESKDVSKQKVVYGAGIYVLREVEGGKFRMSVRVGTESKVVEFSDGDVEGVIGELFSGVAEVKSIDREEEGVEKGVFILYKYV